jgi:hypothetical protein
MSRLNPAALGVADAARVLTRIGGVGGKPVTEEMLRADIEAGAPTNTDGTLNLVHYAAWLVKQSGVRSLESGAAPAARDGGAQRGAPSAADSELRTPDDAD